MALVSEWRFVNSRRCDDSIVVLDPTVAADSEVAEHSRSIFRYLNIRRLCRPARWPGVPLVPDERTEQLAHTCPVLAYALLHPGIRAVPAAAVPGAGGQRRELPDVSLTIKRRLHAMVLQGQPLRDIMAASGLPRACRRLPAGENRRVLRLLPALNDRDIRDFMPADPSLARA